MNDAPVIQTVPSVDPADLLDLYESVGWKAYTRDPKGLATAVANSTYIVEARVNGELVGLARGLSDDVSIFYLQDILVRPEWQRRGVGKALMLDCLERFRHVRSQVLLTDDLPAQHRFYEAMGYQDIRHISDENLHAFVRFED
jgi:GNAT superfamily N-acetyltransferase